MTIFIISVGRTQDLHNDIYVLDSGREETVRWYGQEKGGNGEKMRTWNTRTRGNHGEISSNKCQGCGRQGQGNRETKDRY